MYSNDKTMEIVASLVQAMQLTNKNELKQLLKNYKMIESYNTADDNTKKLVRAFLLKIASMNAVDIAQTIYQYNHWLQSDSEAINSTMQVALEHNNKEAVLGLFTWFFGDPDKIPDLQIFVSILAQLAARPKEEYLDLILQLSNRLQSPQRLALLEQTIAWAKTNNYNQAEPLLLKLLQTTRATMALVAHLKTSLSPAEKQSAIEKFFAQHHQYLHHISFLDLTGIANPGRWQKHCTEWLQQDDVIATLFTHCCRHKIKLRNLAGLLWYSIAHAKLPLLQNLLQFYGQTQQERKQLELSLHFFDIVNNDELPVNANYLMALECLLQYFREHQWPIIQELSLHGDYSHSRPMVLSAPIAKLLVEYNYFAVDEIIYLGLGTMYARGCPQPYFLSYLLENDHYRSQIPTDQYQSISQALWTAICADNEFEQNALKRSKMLPPVATASLMISCCLRDHNARLFEVFDQQAQAQNVFRNMNPKAAKQIMPLLEAARTQFRLLNDQAATEIPKPRLFGGPE